MAFSYGWRGPNIVKDGLVLYLDPGSPNSYFDKTGTIIRDISGQSNNATLVNGPTYNSSNSGNIVFDGVNDYANLGTNINFSTYTNGFTIGFWVKVLNTSQTNRYVFSKLTTAGSDNQFSIVYGYVGSTFELYAGAAGVGANQTIRTNSQILVNDTNWHFLYYTVGATTIGYLDAIAKFTNTYASLTFVSSTNNNLLTTFHGTGFYGNVSIGNMILYNRILSATEITQNFNATRTRFGI
jgi:hypothetical protein